MFTIECRLSVLKNGNNFLEPSKIGLLKEILETGSLSGAAKKLKISYQHAWNLIDEMNKISPEPLVYKQRGGKHGGGAEISIYGKKMLNEFYQIESQLKKWVDQVNTELNL